MPDAPDSKVDQGVSEESEESLGANLDEFEDGEIPLVDDDVAGSLSISEVIDSRSVEDAETEDTADDQEADDKETDQIQEEESPWDEETLRQWGVEPDDTVGAEHFRRLYPKGPDDPSFKKAFRSTMRISGSQGQELGELRKENRELANQVNALMGKLDGFEKMLGEAGAEESPEFLDALDSEIESVQKEKPEASERTVEAIARQRLKVRAKSVADSGEAERRRAAAAVISAAQTAFSLEARRSEHRELGFDANQFVGWLTGAKPVDDAETEMHGMFQRTVEEFGHTVLDNPPVFMRRLRYVMHEAGKLEKKTEEVEENGRGEEEAKEKPKPSRHLQQRAKGSKQVAPSGRGAAIVPDDRMSSSQREAICDEWRTRYADYSSQYQGGTPSEPSPEFVKEMLEVMEEES